MIILRRIAMVVMSSLLTERFISVFVVFLLRKLAESTKNKVDDEIVRMVEKTLAIEK